MQSEEIKTVTLSLPSGEHIQQTLIRENESGLFFCADSSYVEQEVGTIHSPYGHGALQLPEGDDGSSNETSILINKYGKDGEHPKYIRKLWLESVSNGACDDGYWDWVSYLLKHSYTANALEGVDSITPDN